MTAVRKYEDLHDLVDRLTPDGARELRTHALRLVDDAVVSKPEPGETPLFAGVTEDAPPDLAERIEEHITERFNYSCDDTSRMPAVKTSPTSAVFGSSGNCPDRYCSPTRS